MKRLRLKLMDNGLDYENPYYGLARKHRIASGHVELCIEKVLEIMHWDKAPEAIWLELSRKPFKGSTCVILHTYCMSTGELVFSSYIDVRRSCWVELYMMESTVYALAHALELTPTMFEADLKAYFRIRKARL